MFNFNGTEYKSKSVVALNLLNEGKARMEIAKTLGITYQTVHAIMKKAGLKAAPAKKLTKKAKVEIITPVIPITETKTVKKAKKVKKPETQAIENADAN